jgi:hypothetical protein
MYFRKFKNTNREIVRDIALKELKEMVDSEGSRLVTAESTSMIPSELATGAIEKTYSETPEYTEIFDAKVLENLLGIIQSQNLTIKELIELYGKLEKHTDELQEKYDNSMKSKNVTPSGIILSL